MGKINITQSGRGYLLRISASDSCNYDCVFCHPQANQDNNVLTDDELLTLVKEINKMYKLKTIHFTGGEPLLRKNLSNIIKKCREEVEEGIDIAITTNASLLENNIDELVASGLNRINISLHTLKQEKYEKLTNSSVLVSDIKRAIKKALDLGVTIKLNSIVVRGFNDMDIYDIASYCFELGVIPRFLELYLSGPVKDWFSMEDCVTHNEILSLMQEKFGPFELDFTYRGNGATKYYVNNKGQVFGIVQNQTSKTCVGCDRMRLSVNGMLRFCTYQPIDIRPYINSEEKLKQILYQMGKVFEKRGNDYINNRKHEIDYYFRWNQFDKME